jgi:hypothetical protein
MKNFRRKCLHFLTIVSRYFAKISAFSNSNSGFGAGRIALEAGEGGGSAGFHFETGVRERLERRFAGAEEWMGN